MITLMWRSKQVNLRIFFKKTYKGDTTVVRNEEITITKKQGTDFFKEKQRVREDTLRTSKALAVSYFWNKMVLTAFYVLLSRSVTLRLLKRQKGPVETQIMELT